MTDPHKINIIQSIIDTCSSHTLRTSRSRKALAIRIAGAISMYSGRVEDFIREMDGLDLSNSDERQLFMDFIILGL